MKAEDLMQVVKNQKPAYRFSNDDLTFEERKQSIYYAIAGNLDLQESRLHFESRKIMESSGSVKENIIFKSDIWGNVKASMMYHQQFDFQSPVIFLCQGKNYDFEKEINLYNENDISLVLSNNGFRVVMMDYDITNTAAGGREYWDAVYIACGLLGISPLKIILEKQLSLIGWIKEQRWYNQKGIGLIGRSLGGYISAHLGLLSKDIVSVAITNCLYEYKDLIAGGFLVNSLSSLYGALQYYDFSDLVSSIAPKSLHLQYSRNDPYYEEEISERFAGLVKQNYKKYAKNSFLDISVSELLHSTDLEPITAYFKKTL